MARRKILIVSILASVGVAFGLILFDEMIKAFIGFGIIAGWLSVFLIVGFNENETPRKDTVDET